MVLVEGVELRRPLLASGARRQPDGSVESIYAGEESATGVSVRERSEFVVLDGLLHWRRRFTATGLRPGVEVVLLVPTATPGGAPLESFVHGARLEPAPGAHEARVPLARDESTTVDVRLPVTAR